MIVGFEFLVIAVVVAQEGDDLRDRNIFTLIENCTDNHLIGR